MSDIVSKINVMLSESNSVANEILRQIRAIDSNALNYWSAKEFVSNENSLRFKVHTPAFNGIIRIVLDADDTYSIEKAKISNFQYKILDRKEDIYAENLVRVINYMLGIED